MNTDDDSDQDNTQMTMDDNKLANTGSKVFSYVAVLALLLSIFITMKSKLNSKEQ